MDRGRVGEDRGSKETDGCPLTLGGKYQHEEHHARRIRLTQQTWPCACAPRVPIPFVPFVLLPLISPFFLFSYAHLFIPFVNTQRERTRRVLIA
jgi:hypothetical protein